MTCEESAVESFSLFSTTWIRIHIVAEYGSNSNPDSQHCLYLPIYSRFPPPPHKDTCLVGDWPNCWLKRATVLDIYLFGGGLAELLAEKSHHVEDLPDDPALGQRVGYLAVHALQAPQGPRHPHQPRVVLKIKYKIVYYLFFKNSHVLRPKIRI